MKYYFLKKCSYCEEMCERDYDIKKATCVSCRVKRSSMLRKLKSPQQEDKVNMKLAKVVFWELYSKPNCYHHLSEKYNLNYKEIIFLQEEFANYISEPIYNHRANIALQ